ATSSPRIKTVGSRRISSTRASLMASPNVISLVAVSGIHVLIDFVCIRIRRVHGELNRFLHLRLDFGMNLIEAGAVGNLFGNQPIAEEGDGIAFSFPELFFLLRPVVFAIDVADMVSRKPVGAAEQKLRSSTGACTVDQFRRRIEHGLDILTIDTLAGNSKTFGAREN